MTKEQLISELNETFPKLMRLYHHRLSSLTEESLTMVQFFALKCLDEGERTVGDLAADLMVSPSAISGTVDRLVDMGLVERQPDDRDRRLVWIRTTGEGRRREEEFEVKRRQVAEQLFARLTVTETASLLRLLEKLIGRDGNGPTRGHAGKNGRSNS